MLSYENFKHKEKIIRLFAFALGDGWLYRVKANRYQLFYSGRIETLKAIQKELGRIGINSGIDQKRRILAVYSRTLARRFYELGFPIGKKTNQEYNIPNWVFDLPRSLRKEFIKALWSADGSLPNMIRYTARAMYYTIVKTPDKKYSGINFLMQLRELLKHFDIQAAENIYEFRQKNNIGLRLMIYGEQNIIKYLKKIGYIYDTWKIKRAKIILEYLERKKQLIARKQKERIWKTDMPDFQTYCKSFIK